MRIRAILSIKGKAGVAARAKWIELGGDPACVRNAKIQTVISVEDEASSAGEALRRLLDATVRTRDWNLMRTAAFSDDELRTAELQRVDAASFDEAVDPTQVARAPECRGCGRTDFWGDTKDGRAPRVVNPRCADLDLWITGPWWMVSTALADKLRPLRGAVLESLPVATGLPDVHVLRGRSSLGHPADGTTWSAPCAVCGRRDGVPPGDFLRNVLTYPRSAWNGDDIITAAQPEHALFVSQRAAAVLCERAWRLLDPGIVTTPVILDPDAQPLP